MKTVFWAQNPRPTENDTLIVDTKGINALSSEEIEEAHTLIKQFACDSMLVTDANKVCSKYNVPANFKIWLHPQKGIMLQSSLIEKDLSNRSMPFVIWHYKGDIYELTRILSEYLLTINSTIADGDIDLYRKIYKDIIASRIRIVLLIVIIIILIVFSTICLTVY